MKLSDIDINIVSQYIGIPIDLNDNMEVMEMNMYIESAKSFIVENSGRLIEDLDQKPYAVIPALQLISDMYENKTLDGYKLNNQTFESMMNLINERSL